MIRDSATPFPHVTGCGVRVHRCSTCGLRYAIRRNEPGPPKCTRCLHPQTLNRESANRPETAFSAKGYEALTEIRELLGLGFRPPPWERADDPDEIPF